MPNEVPISLKKFYRLTRYVPVTVYPVAFSIKNADGSPYISEDGCDYSNPTYLLPVLNPHSNNFLMCLNDLRSKFEAMINRSVWSSKLVRLSIINTINTEEKNSDSTVVLFKDSVPPEFSFADWVSLSRVDVVRLCDVISKCLDIRESKPLFSGKVTTHVFYQRQWIDTFEGKVTQEYVRELSYRIILASVYGGNSLGIIKSLRDDPVRIKEMTLVQILKTIRCNPDSVHYFLSMYVDTNQDMYDMIQIFHSQVQTNKYLHEKLDELFELFESNDEFVQETRSKLSTLDQDVSCLNHRMGQTLKTPKTRKVSKRRRSGGKV